MNSPHLPLQLISHVCIHLSLLTHGQLFPAVLLLLRFLHLNAFPLHRGKRIPETLQLPAIKATDFPIPGLVLQSQ